MTNDQLPTWTVEVVDLLEIFATALRSLAPVVETAHIHWRDESVDDEWDDIARNLYEVVVGRTLKCDRRFDTATHCPIAPYDLGLPDYSKKSVIGTTERDGYVQLFSHLMSGDGEFNCAVTIEIDRSGNRTNGPGLEVPLTDVEWFFVARTFDGESKFLNPVISEL